MRLTDRKTVAELKANADRLRELGFEPTILDRRYIKLAEYEDAEELIKTTTDAEHVKHGRWICSDDKYWLTCPFCDTDVDVSCGIPIYVDNDEVNHINFCPNCGARMDGD